ncbi:MAG: hypothetical protein J6X89_07915 [Bacteroidales bacterium]|nr:hypothetical protein [Bacteroidales bacterium]
MKKFSLIAIVLLAVSFSAGAQGREDALRYSEQNYVGSARTIAMGNAFTALGGDLGALSINPASSALYNCCEFAITSGFQWETNKAVFSTSENDYTSPVAKRTVFTVPNISVVFALPTGRDRGLVNTTFGFGYNKIANFNTHVSFNGNHTGSSLLGNLAEGLEGVDNSELLADDAFEVGYCTNQEILAFDAFLLNPYHNMTDSYLGATENEWTDGLGVDNILNMNYDRIRKGGIYDMAFNFGLNFSDKLYIGANLNFNIVNFVDDLLYEEDGMLAGNYFQSGFKSMSYNYWQQTDGVGVNAQIGAIWVPTRFLRLGASYTTPTLYNLTDTWQETMVSEFDGTTDCKSVTSQSPWKSYQYQVKAPQRYSLGAAFVFGRSGLVSIDYESTKYYNTKMADGNGNQNTFNDVNDIIQRTCSKCDILRLGCELNTFNDCSLRAGYNIYLYDIPYRYVSFGLGKRVSENSTLDFAFRYRLTDNYSMKPYDDYAFDDTVMEYKCEAPAAGIANRAYDLLLTWRVKF